MEWLDGVPCINLEGLGKMNLEIGTFGFRDTSGNSLYSQIKFKGNLYIKDLHNINNPRVFIKESKVSFEGPKYNLRDRNSFLCVGGESNMGLGMLKYTYCKSSRD